MTPPQKTLDVFHMSLHSVHPEFTVHSCKVVTKRPRYVKMCVVAVVYGRQSVSNIQIHLLQEVPEYRKNLST